MKLLEKTGLNRINVDRKKICLFMIYALAALTVFLSIIPNKQDVIIAIAFVLLNTFKIIVFVFIGYNMYRIYINYIDGIISSLDMLILEFALVVAWLLFLVFFLLVLW